MELKGTLMSRNRAAAELRSGKVLPLDRARMPLCLQSRGDLPGWEVLSSPVQNTLPRAEICRDYVLCMVESRWQVLAAGQGKQLHTHQRGQKTPGKGPVDTSPSGWQG